MQGLKALGGEDARKKRRLRGAGSNRKKATVKRKMIHVRGGIAVRMTKGKKKSKHVEGDTSAVCRNPKIPCRKLEALQLPAKAAGISGGRNDSFWGGRSQHSLKRKR